MAGTELSAETGDDDSCTGDDSGGDEEGNEMTAVTPLVDDDDKDDDEEDKDCTCSGRGSGRPSDGEEEETLLLVSILTSVVTSARIICRFEGRLVVVLLFADTRICVRPGLCSRVGGLPFPCMLTTACRFVCACIAVIVDANVLWSSA